MPGEIVLAAELPRPEPVRDLIAEAGEPETGRAVAEQHGAVLEQGMPTFIERAARPADIVPPVVIAEDRPHAERRREPRELAGPDRMRVRAR